MHGVTYQPSRQKHEGCMSDAFGVCSSGGVEEGGKTLSSVQRNGRRISHSIRVYCSGLIVISHN